MKTVLIIGGSSGIGAATTRLAAQNGWRVFFTYRTNAAAAEALVAELQPHPVEAIPVSLEDPASYTRALATLAHQGAVLDALVLSASPAPILNAFTKQTPENLLAQFAVNVVASQQLIAQVWKLFFQKHHGGHVVAMLSAAAGSPPWGNLASYVVAKRALQALLECALVELGASGLRASALLPTYTDTPMLQALDRHILDMARSRQPGGQFLKAEEVAERVVNCLEHPPADAVLALHP